MRRLVVMRHLSSLYSVLIAFSLSWVCSSSGEAQKEASPIPPGWRTYTDTTYRFTILYPDDFGILPEPSSLPSGAIKRVRFQDKQILSGQFAELEPSRFTIEVFKPGPASSLTEWLRSRNRLPPDAVITTVSLNGAREGVRVQRRQQLAPNEFYYFATTDYVYALIPLAEYGTKMIASFRLL